jgi:hypothetical protein
MATQRAVAFLDVLGFRDKIYTMPLDALAFNYERVIRQIRWINQQQFLGAAPGLPSLFPNANSNDRPCIQHPFSDSIILIALGDDDESLLKLLVYTWRLTQLLLAFGMHPRGAITFGEMHVNESESIFLGKALTKAYALEQRQDWIGVALDRSVEARYGHIVNAYASPASRYPFLVRHAVPLKRTDRKRKPSQDSRRKSSRYERRSLIVINWRWNLVAKAGTRALLPASPKRDVRVKVAHTVTYLKKIVASGALYPTNENQVPVELRMFYAGDSEPPFRHGDEL